MPTERHFFPLTKENNLQGMLRSSFVRMENKALVSFLPGLSRPDEEDHHGCSW